LWGFEVTDADGYLTCTALLYTLEQTILTQGETLGMVVSRSERLSALVLIVALVGATSSTLIAQAAQPDACVMTHHECDQTTKVTDCCCHASDATHQGGPIESRVQLAVDLSPHPVALARGTFEDTARNSVQLHTPPPSVSPPDPASRFAPLLI
jgi:hypothetical protein